MLLAMANTPGVPEAMGLVGIRDSMRDAQTGDSSELNAISIILTWALGPIGTVR